MRNWFNGAMGFVPAYATAGYDRAAPKQEKQHHWQLMSSSASRRNSTGGGGRSEQTSSQGITRRAVIALLLLVVLPPVGILMMWRRGIFQLRGRVLLTVVSVAILTAMFTFMMPSGTVVEVQPSAVKAGLRTPLPTDAALNALSNMEELLAGVENQPITATDETAVTEETVTEETVVAETEEPEDVMQQVVYSVRSGAKYYHTSGECNGQVNRRSLTVQQAISEGLKPCTRCDPPSP